jgi:hypothetical protein
VRIQACRDAAQRFKSTGHQFNPDNTDECLKKLADAFKSLPISPQLLNELDDQCARVFAGAGKVTDPCVADFDCASGLICDKLRCGTLKVVPSGSGCANIGERCQADEFCTNDNPNMLYMCMHRLPEGAPCSPSRPCASSFRCQNTCVRKLKLQDPCNNDEDCETGYCDPYTSVPKCGAGLSFASESTSCKAYMSSTPVRGNNEVMDGGAADSGTD